MLIPSIQLASVSIDAIDSKFLSDLNILSDVSLRIPASRVADDATSIQSLHEVIRSIINSYHGIYIEGFSVYDEEIVAACLDKGLKIAFVDYSASVKTPDESSIDQQVYLDAINTLPRSRMGISCDLSHLATASIIETLRSTITVFETVVEHFLFR
jgi:hypothetical protein